MKVALVDDDSTLLSHLYELVSSELSRIGDTAHTITTYSSGEEFLEIFSKGSFDLIILDIFMAEMTGVEVARKIRETDDSVRLAFCTSSNEYASESYEVDAQYYLRKPITEANVALMFKRLNLEVVEKNKILQLPDGHLVMARKILYTEYNNHVITVYIKGENAHRFRSSQAEAEKNLFEYKFFYSPCKGIILNFYEVTKITDDSFVMSNGTVIPISRRKQKESMQLYTAFRFEKMRKEVQI